MAVVIFLLLLPSPNWNFLGMNKVLVNLTDFNRQVQCLLKEKMVSVN